MPTRFHELTITAIRHPSAESTALTFAVPAELQPHFQHVPGQYVTLRALADSPLLTKASSSLLAADDDGRRSYSICSTSLESDTFEVGIKQVPDGFFSNLASGFTVGDRVEVMSPQGNFVAPVGGIHHYLLVAAGSGITPCLSIAKSILEAEPESRISLLYGNRTLQSIMFRNDIDELKDRYTARFSTLHILSEEQQEVDWCNGRIDRSKLQLLVAKGVIEPSAFDAVYCCGPYAMIECVRDTLTEFGVATDKIKFELFNTAGVESATTSRNSSVSRAASVDAVSTVGTRVTIVFDGAEKVVPVNAAQETVLTAARKAGLDLPFSCQGGMCCTCRCKILAGEATMDANFSLADWEVEAGFTLACQARPLTDKLILDFDAS